MSKKARPWTRQQRRRIRWRTEAPIRRKEYERALVAIVTADVEALWRYADASRWWWRAPERTPVLNWPEGVNADL